MKRAPECGGPSRGLCSLRCLPDPKERQQKFVQHLIGVAGKLHLVAVAVAGGRGGVRDVGLAQGLGDVPLSLSFILDFLCSGAE